MSKLMGILPIVVLISYIGFIYFSNKPTSPESSSSAFPKSTGMTESPVADIQASFAIFTNGTFRVFTANMYHNLSPDVFIEASNPNIVRVKKSRATWNDFFSTLPFTLTAKCLTTGTKETFCTGSKGELQFYLNGENNGDALSQEIRNGDKLLVTYGSESEAQIKQQIERIP